MNDNRESATSERPEPLTRPVMPELDTIRGLAVLGVLIYHSFYWNVPISLFPSTRACASDSRRAGAVSGVDLFFVLSGFLITGIPLHARSQPKYYKKFYVRRALRILPAYLLIIFVADCFTSCSLFLCRVERRLSFKSRAIFRRADGLPSFVVAGRRRTFLFLVGRSGR